MKTRTRTTTMMMVVVQEMTATAPKPSDGHRCSAASARPYSPRERLP